MKKPERSHWGTQGGKGKASWGNTFWLCSEQAGSEKVKGNRRQVMQKAKYKGPGVRPTVTTAGRGEPLAGGAGPAGAKVLTFEFTSL